jgi:hypothetical protein
MGTRVLRKDIGRLSSSKFNEDERDMMGWDRDNRSTMLVESIISPYFPCFDLYLVTPILKITSHRESTYNISAAYSKLTH